MATSIGFQNSSHTNALKVTELRLEPDAKTGKVRFQRGNTRIVQAKGRGQPGEDSAVLWLDPGKVKFEIEALPS